MLLGQYFRNTPELSCAEAWSESAILIREFLNVQCTHAHRYGWYDTADEKNGLITQDNISN